MLRSEPIEGEAKSFSQEAEGHRTAKALIIHIAVLINGEVA